MATEDIIAPAIREKNRLRHCFHDSGSLSPNEITAIKSHYLVTPYHQDGFLRYPS